MRQYAPAKNAYAETAVLTASPERLVVMLYDGAIRFLHQAAAAVRAGDPIRTRDRLRRAEAIIDELNHTLDFERGGEIATHLRGIYLFCKRRLLECNLHRDAEGITQVAALLGELRESWESVASEALRKSA